MFTVVLSKSHCAATLPKATITFRLNHLELASEEGLAFADLIWTQDYGSPEVDI